jgi:uncharacterized membrane protein YgdD (TMEM256/DUF423 family)
MMAIAIAMGAFGAHGLKPHLTEKALQTYMTGQEYLVIGALSLLALGFMDTILPQKAFRTLSWTMGVGTAIFTGTLMMISLAGLRWAGAITPIGGALLIGSWCAAGWILASGSRMKA